LKAKDVPPLRKYWAEGGAGVNGFAKDKMFFAEGMRLGGTLWEYYTEFAQCLQNPAVLTLVFEDMVQDIEAVLPTIAAFMGLKLSAASIQEVSTMCSKSFMAQHGSKFDESWTYKRMGELGVKDRSSMAPAPRVIVNEHKEVITAETQAYLAEKWAASVGTLSAELVVGAAPAPLHDYTAVCQAIRAELSRRSNPSSL